MKQNTTMLDEVVLKTNINDTDMRKATGSIAKIKAQDIEEIATMNFVESLRGQVAGIVISTSGELGSVPKIRIRGTSTLSRKTKGKYSNKDLEYNDNKANQPLFVLDGQIISAEAFATINIQDIKDIKVLKDAAANALYGIKAANGIIEITSKRGVKGKTMYTYSFQQGITLRGKAGVDMMDSTEKLEFERLAKNENNPGYYYSEDYIRKKFRDETQIQITNRIIDGNKKLDSLRAINTNWFDQLSMISKYESHNLSMSGGNEDSKFFISTNISSQGGKFLGNDIGRVTARLNFEHNLSKKLHIVFNSNLGLSESNTQNTSVSSPSDLIYRLNPYEQKGQETKLISFPNKTYADLIDQYSSKTISKRFNFSMNAFWKINNRLNISSVFGTDYVYGTSESITPPTALSEQRLGLKDYLRGKASKSEKGSNNISSNIRINYELPLGDHNISLSANMDYLKTTQNTTNISGYGLPSKLNSAAGINNTIDGYRRSLAYSRYTQEAQLGFGGAFLYNYDNILDVYFSYKADASSLLPKDKRWNIFWATGISYNLHFIETPILSDVSIKASYGVTASLAGINPSLVEPTFAYSLNGYLGYREFYLIDMYNEDLKPERNTSINIGVDMRLMNKVDLNIQYYYRRTSQMLLTVPIPPSNGFTSQLKNVGVLDNKGIELTANAYVFSNKNYSWHSSFNLSYNKNVIVDLYDGDELYLSGNPYPDYKEGYSSDIIYGLKSLGIHPADGLPRYLRADGTTFNSQSEKAKADDFIILGRNTPPIVGGWNNQLKYQQWAFSFSLYYNIGGIAVYKNQSVVSSASDANKNAIKGQLENTWFNIGDNNKLYHKLYYSFGGNLYLNEGYANNLSVGKTDFIKLSNIKIKYKLSEKQLGKLKNTIKSLNVYLQLKEIATWSNFGDSDPESANLVGSSQPIISLGLNITI